MKPTVWPTMALRRASPHLRARALWVGVFALAALLLQAAGPSLPTRSAEGVAAMLGGAVGGEVRAEDFVWEARGGFWSDAFLGRQVLFLARRPVAMGETPNPPAPADLYRARVRLTRAGQPLSLGFVRNLTRSPLGDDRDLVAFGHRAAYLTSAFGAVQGVTLLDLDGEGDAREARGWVERAASALESWLATGSTRGVGRTEVTFGAPPAEAREELEGELLVMALGKEALPAALDGRDGSLNTGPSNTFVAAAQRIPHRPPAVGEVTVRAVRAVAGPGAASAVGTVVGALERTAHRLGAGRKRAAATIAEAHAPDAMVLPIEDGWPPAAIAPLVQPGLAGEGTWTAGRVERAGEAPPCVIEASIRPDPARPEALVRLWALDTRQLDLRLVAGVDEPRSEVGLHGGGRLPEETPAARAVVAFAGGPAAAIAATEPGFVAERRVLALPSPGLATVAMGSDGRVLLGAWGAATEVPAGLLSIRQTPDAILGWAPPARRPLIGAGDVVERSALGLTGAGQLVYAWSAAARAPTLARALELAGCTFAVPLAAAPASASVGLAYLGPQVAVAAPGMSMSLAGLAGRSANDLFYAVLRSTGPPPLSAAAGAFAPDGGRQPSPAWLPAIHGAVVTSLGAQVHLTSFAPGRPGVSRAPGRPRAGHQGGRRAPDRAPRGRGGARPGDGRARGGAQAGRARAHHRRGRRAAVPQRRRGRAGGRPRAGAGAPRRRDRAGRAHLRGRAPPHRRRRQAAARGPGGGHHEVPGGGLRARGRHLLRGGDHLRQRRGGHHRAARPGLHARGRARPGRAPVGVRPPRRHPAGARAALRRERAVRGGGPALGPRRAALALELGTPYAGSARRISRSLSSARARICEMRGSLTPSSAPMSLSRLPSR